MPPCTRAAVALVALACVCAAIVEAITISDSCAPTARGVCPNSTSIAIRPGASLVLGAAPSPTASPAAVL